MKLKQVLQAGKAYGGLNLPRLFPLMKSEDNRGHGDKCNEGKQYLGSERLIQAQQG